MNDQQIQDSILKIRRYTKPIIFVLLEGGHMIQCHTIEYDSRTSLVTTSNTLAIERPTTTDINAATVQAISHYEGGHVA